MKGKRLLIIAVMLIFIMAAPMTVFADDNGYDYEYSPYHVYTYATGDDDEWDLWEPAPRISIEEMFRTRDNQTPIYVRLRAFAESEGAWDVRWDQEARVARIVTWGGDFIVIEVEAKGGFIEDGVAWIPLTVAADLQEQLRDAWWGSDPVDRIDLTIWEAYRFEDIRDEPMFSTELPHGEISLGYIEYMSDNLYARSPFTYRELETAIWIVEELLAMGHDWDYIMAQEFTYWDVRDLEWSASGWGWLSWWMVTSEMLLGTGREYQIRLDRVSQNIILTIPGQSDSKIIVGAHYDSPPYPSASDNASGTALLLESAQRMLELDNYHTIVYIFFGAEEVGLIGAHYYYQMLTEAERENILFMINADVLIEGPYIIFGTGKFPVIDYDAADELIEAILEVREADLIQWLDEECLGCGQTGFEKWNMWTEEPISRQEILDMMLEGEREWLEWTPLESLVLIAMRQGVLEAYECEIAQKINEIATELNSTHNFELLSLPEFAMAPSDHLIFFHEGHTVVNFAGMERAENVAYILSDYIGEMWLRLEHLGEGFSTTILHSPLDEFHKIESLWPGMMRNNMEAFSIFLERILTTRFY